MESINECFLLEKELRGVVQKGMRGNVGAVEYLEEVSGMFPDRDPIIQLAHCCSLQYTEQGTRLNSVNLLVGDQSRITNKRPCCFGSMPQQKQEALVCVVPAV